MRGLDRVRPQPSKPENLRDIEADTVEEVLVASIAVVTIKPRRLVLTLMEEKGIGRPLVVGADEADQS